MDIKHAFTRELTDSRVDTAAAYWLDASPHERTEADGIILARYARVAMVKISQQQAEIERLDRAYELLKYVIEEHTEYKTIAAALRQAQRIKKGDGEQG